MLCSTITARTLALAALIMGAAACANSVDVLAAAPPTQLPFGNRGGGVSDRSGLGFLNS